MYSYRITGHGDCPPYGHGLVFPVVINRMLSYPNAPAG